MEGLTERLPLKSNWLLLLLISLSELSLDLSAWWRKRKIRGFLPELIQLLSPKKDDVILDLGAGTGVIAEEVSKLCDEVFALEPDPKRVNYIKKKYPSVKAFDGAAEAIQFPEFYFTKIYAISSMHHFKDKDAALFEIHRVLKHGGLLIVKDSEPDSRTSSFEHRAAHIEFLTSDKLREKLETTGFEIKSAESLRRNGYFVCSSKP